MPESDQWNGDDELPKNNHGDLAAETARSIAQIVGAENTELVQDGGEESEGNSDEDNAVEAAKEKKSQGDAHKAEQGKTTAERAEKKAEPKGENKEEPKGEDKSENESALGSPAASPDSEAKGGKAGGKTPSVK